MIKDCIPQVDIQIGLNSSLHMMRPQQMQELIYARAITDLIRTYYHRISNDSLARILFTMNILHQQRPEDPKSTIDKLTTEEKGILRAIYPF